MSEPSIANETVHDLRGRKIHALEEVRVKSIETFAQPALAEVHKSDSENELLIPIEEHKAAELVAELQQKLVINSPADSEQVINQADADEQLDADNNAQQQSIAQTVSEITPTAPPLDATSEKDDRTDDFTENEENFSSVSNVEVEQSNQQEVSLRPLYPKLTSTPQGSVRVSKSSLLDSPIADTSLHDQTTSKDELETTKYNEIITIASTCKKELKFDAIPTYEQSEKAKMEGCDRFALSSQAPGPAYHIPIADTIIAPKTFSGTSAESGEEWLEYLEKYFEFRHLRDEDKIRLFGMLLRGSASDWMSTLTRQQLNTYDDLREAFKETYYPSHELRYKEASALWREVQGPHEKFDDFLTRLKRGARRCEISDELLHLAVLNGLRPNIRCQILSSGIKDLPETIRLARAAEATLSTDPVTALLLENMKNASQIADKQSQEIKELSAKLSAIQTTAAINQIAQRSEASAVAATTENMHSGQMNRAFNPRSTDSRNERNYDAQRLRGPQMRAPQPRNWRNNGARQTARSAAQQQQNLCGKCGLDHSRGNCPANNQVCRKCQRVGHYARCCRSGQLRRE
jgi:hypothetical protein